MGITMSLKKLQQGSVIMVGLMPSCTDA